jgi:OmpA-OmpF porin, OOP family
MSSRSRSTTLVLCAALAAGTAGAANAEGLYLGGDLGHPLYGNNVNGIGGGDSASNGGVGAKLYGGYALSPNLAVEGGLFRLGHSHDGSTGDTVNTKGVFVDGVGTYKFAPQWSALGRVGLAEGRFTTTLGDDTSAAVKAGAGVQYDVNPQVGLRLQYERYHFFNAFDGKPNVGEVTAGVKVNF